MKKILVIEDNTEVRENICEILELDSYEVIAAENGKIGVEKAISENPDLILCDVMMPELDGFGVLRILNRNPKTYHIPFIYLTAKAEKEDLRKGMGLGAEDYITKPFDDTQLLEAIDVRIKKAERINSSFDQTDNGLQQFFSEAKAHEELQKIALDKELRNYNKKDLIYDEGQTARWLFFIVEGQVKELQTNEFGKELIVKIHKEGEFFGYYPLLNDTKYTNSAISMQDCILRLIPKEDFSILLFNNKDFAAQFIKMLANQAEDTERLLIDLAYSSVRKKVANALVSFAESISSSLEDIRITVTREDLASRAGTAKETLIRTLSDFKNEGLISIDQKSIDIPDLNELKNLLA